MRAALAEIPDGIYRGASIVEDDGRSGELEIGCAEAQFLFETVGEDELVDPTLTPETLLYRLFHERGVRVFDTAPVRAQCSCSRENVEAMLRRFSQDDRDHMVENGVIAVTCEFCNGSYVFHPADVANGEADSP